MQEMCALLILCWQWCPSGVHCVFGLYIGLGTQKERAAGNPLKVSAGDMEARI